MCVRKCKLHSKYLSYNEYVQCILNDKQFEFKKLVDCQWPWKDESLGSCHY